MRNRYEIEGSDSAEDLENEEAMLCFAKISNCKKNNLKSDNPNAKRLTQIWIPKSGNVDFFCY